MATNNFGRLCRDGIFGDIQIKDKTVITKERELQHITKATIGNVCAKTLTVDTIQIVGSICGNLVIKDNVDIMGTLTVDGQPITGGGGGGGPAVPTSGLFATFPIDQGGSGDNNFFGALVPMDTESGDFLDAPGKVVLEPDVSTALQRHLTPGPLDGQISYRYVLVPPDSVDSELWIATRSMDTGDTEFTQIAVDPYDYSGGGLFGQNLLQRRAPIVWDGANDRYLGVYFGEGEGEGEGAPKYLLVSLNGPGNNSIITFGQTGFGGGFGREATGVAWIGSRLLSCHRAPERYLIEWNTTTGSPITSVSWDGTFIFSGTQHKFVISSQWVFTGIAYDPDTTRVYFLFAGEGSPRVCGYALAADVFGDGGSLAFDFNITLLRHTLPSRYVNSIVWVEDSN